MLGYEVEEENEQSELLREKVLVVLPKGGWWRGRAGEGSKGENHIASLF